MSLCFVRVANYRSVERLTFPVEACSVFVGANGVGKTNLYKALALLQRAADGSITRAVADEGGLASVLWAGPRAGKAPVRLQLRAEFDADDANASYDIEIGLPQAVNEAAFQLEPRVKAERLSIRHGRRDVVMLERNNALVTLRNEKGARETVDDAVLPSETALAAFRDGARYPELEAVRRAMQDWRLYHDFRTDAASPVRQPCHAITTPTLSADGHDLAAVLATLSLIRQDTVDVDAAIRDAFPGATLSAADDGRFCRLSMTFPDVQRPFEMHELSDGTLKYLCLLGALMSYRLPSLIALNEPEASLHPDLMPPLARLIGKAAQRSRVWVVTHSEALADAILDVTGKRARRVVKQAGATTIEGLTRVGTFRDDEDDNDTEEE